MKRRRQNITGKAQFLPVLPAGNLEEWLSDHCQASSDHSHSVKENAGSFGHVSSFVKPRTERSGPQLESGQTSYPLKASGNRREDMPVVRKQNAQSGRNSFEFMSCPAAVDEAMDSLRKDFFAASSRKPRDALLQTWCRFHKQWFGNDEIVPLTKESIEKVSCLFKLGGYKSYKNYLSRAKELHCEHGHAWTQSLQNIARRCTRSVLRGLGGPSRSEAFDLCTVVEFLKHNVIDCSCDSPESPLAAVVVGTYFLLRELELSAIDMEDVSFTHNSITLSLPVSKVDWQAKGCRRTWSCVCELGHHCPVHILQEYDARLRSEGRNTGPWLVSKSNDRCTKLGVVDMIRKAVLASGGSATDAEGNWFISGHTFRITGARTLAAWGLDPITIQLLGRWGSSAVLGYLAETPLLAFADRLGPNGNRKLSNKWISSTDADGLADHDAAIERAQLRKEISELRNRVSDLSAALDGVIEVVDKRSVREAWWVLNDASKVLHTAVVDLSTPPSTWKTACGWKFSGQPKITTLREAPTIMPGRNCPKCMPGNHDTTSSSSSESSS